MSAAAEHQLPPRRTIELELVRKFSNPKLVLVVEEEAAARIAAVVARQR